VSEFGEWEWECDEGGVKCERDEKTSKKDSGNAGNGFQKFSYFNRRAAYMWFRDQKIH
jgi:hypothetical protein